MSLSPWSSDYLSAEGGGRLLSAALPCSVGPIDVVEPGNAALNAEVLVVVHAELLCGQLFQAVSILGLQGTAYLSEDSCGNRSRYQ